MYQHALEKPILLLNPMCIGCIIRRRLYEFYFEEGELHMPPNFDDTEEERKAGFGETK
jgi:hypothetical protein